MPDEPNNSETNQIVIILKTQNLYHTTSLARGVINRLLGPEGPFRLGNPSNNGIIGPSRSGSPAGVMLLRHGGEVVFLYRHAEVGWLHGGAHN
jgi:hypothetical protein